ncbi:MAG: hypothetical protein ACJ8G3_19810 [Burkholderiaceae bacterium]
MPFAKALVVAIPPVMLAAQLYLGSGISLLAWFCLRLARHRARLLASIRDGWPAPFYLAAL